MVKWLVRHPLHKLLMTEKRGGARHHNRPYRKTKILKFLLIFR